MKVGRNEICPCGSNKKYKKCCFAKDSLLLTAAPHSPFEAECDYALERLESGDTGYANGLAERLICEHPNDHMVNFLKGVCHLVKEEHKEGLPYFEKAAETHPTFPEAHINLAAIYVKEGLLSKAVATYRKIIEFEPKHSEIRRQAERELQNLQAAIKESTGLTLDKIIGHEKLFNDAFVCMNQKDFEGAIHRFQQILVAEPNHVQSYGNMALAYSSLGQNKKAMECLTTALALDPKYEPARVNLKVIERLREGEKLNNEVKDVSFYRDGLQ